MATSEKYDGTCKVTELVYIQYTVSFRPGMTFADTVKRVCPEGLTYADVIAECYNSMTRAAINRYQVTIVAIKNGWR